MNQISKISKILVPLDGSKMSQKAFQHALQLGKTLKAELVLLTVIPDYIIPAASYKVIAHTSLVEKFVEETYAIAKQEATDLLEKNIQECEKEGVRASHRILRGDAALEILNAAKKLKIDMVVIGSVGLSGIRKLVALGSVSRKVSELCTCPVLIIR